MQFSRSILFWLGALAFGLLFLWMFSGVLLPFVAGMAVAYLLDPLAGRLERIGMSRMGAAVTIVLSFVLLLILGFTMIVPVLTNQLAGFISNLPGYVATLQQFLTDRFGDQLPDFVAQSRSELEGSVSQIVTQVATWLLSLMQSLWSGGQALAAVVALFIVTPVVAFYLLLDWPRMIKAVDGWLPRDNAETLRGLFREMDAGVANFVRGQTSVSATLGLFYAVSLSLAGLNFGLLIGLGAGVISFIPYIGALLGGIVAIGVAIVQFWPDWTWILVIAGIFAAGQFLEGNILQPWLLGSTVGVHPVWLMFALFAFASLFGFVGMLIAVPAATAIAVLCRFALRRYLDSPFYHGKAATVVDLQREAGE